MFNGRFLEDLRPITLARIALCQDQTYIIRYAAREIMTKKLSPYNGALWIGVPLQDRADVIRALRLDMPKTKFAEALCRTPY